MSVVGIDFGNKSGVIAVARKGGIDILENESGNRQTPNMVGFPAPGATSLAQKRRAVGEMAQTNFNRNMKNTAVDVKRWLGVPCVSAAFDANDAARLTCPLVDSPPESTPEAQRRLQTVMYKVGAHTLRPEQVAAVFLAHLKSISEKHTCKPCRDVVLSVPGWWTERQRRALLDAASIAGLNVLRLMNEHAAVALTYGLVKADLPEDPAAARKVLFVDMGHSSTTAQVVAFSKGRMVVQGVAYDPCLGGRNFDEAVAAKIADDATKKLRAEYDLRDSPRAWQRILAACEKQVKRVISAGTPRATLAIDNLANDMDYNVVIQRDEFLALVKPLVERIATPVQLAMEHAKATPQDLYSIEVVGGGMRLPCCQEFLSQLMGGRPLSRTINMEEGVAKGCAWMCAMLSPLFHVKPFEVVDITPYAIRLAWEPIAPAPAADPQQPKEGTGNAIVIQEYNPVPAPKTVTFKRNDGIRITAFYDDPVRTPYCPNHDGWIGTYTIPTIPPASKPDIKPKLVVHAQLDIHGLFSVTSAETNEVIEETVEVEEPVKPKTPPPAAAATTPAAAPAPQQAAPAPAQPAEAAPAAATTDPAAPAQAQPAATPAPAAPAQAPAPATVKRTEVRKRTERKDVPVQSEMLGLRRAEIDSLRDVEYRMAQDDQLAVETAEAKNQLETYQYTMRDRLAASDYGSSEKSLALFGEEKDVADFVRRLESVRDWLYDEGEEQPKDVYQRVFKELKTIGDNYVRRKTEFDARPAAVADLEARVRFWACAAAADNKDEKYSHIEAAEREKVRARCAETGAWLTEQRNKQDALPLFKDPVLTVADLQSKRSQLDSFAASIMNKPKPPPPKPAPAPAPAQTTTPPPTPAEAGAAGAQQPAQQPAQQQAQQQPQQPATEQAAPAPASQQQA